MKKNIALLTALALCLTLLAACGGKANESGSGQTEQPSQSEPAGTETPEPSETPEEPSDAPEESSQPVVVESPSPSDVPAEPEPSEIVEEAPALTLSMKDATITYAGYVLTLKPTMTGVDGNPALTWTSDDNSVASVDDKGNVTSIAPGKTVITAKTADGRLTASCIVRCRWTEDTAPAESESQKPSAGVDLSAFASDLFGRYEFSGSETLADSTLLDNLYPGLTGISTRQCLVYVPQITMNTGELALVEVSDAADAAAVKAILQARIDYMVGDGNGPGGAWYPEAMDTWENQSRVVSSGNYVMMIVGEHCDSIVSDFKALF